MSLITLKFKSSRLEKEVRTVWQQLKVKRAVIFVYTNFWKLRTSNAPCFHLASLTGVLLHQLRFAFFFVDENSLPGFGV